MNATLKIHSVASAAQSAQSVLSTVLSRVARLAERVSATLREEEQAQRAIEELGTLNERQLRDIGLMRSDIESAVRGLNHFSR